MKRTNFQLFDFLDFDPALSENEFLWKACRPVSVEERNGDIEIEIPFQRQIRSVDINPDRNVPRKNFVFKLRSYGEGIIRFGAGFGTEPFRDSEILEIDSGLKTGDLSVGNSGSGWTIKDIDGRLLASINLSEPDIKHWSDLVPGPEETFELVLYPGSSGEIRLNAYDHFFPARQDAFPLAFVERNGRPHRTTLSFHCNPDEVFTGTGERFAKMDLSGMTVRLKNQDGQGVNSRRTYKNIPFYLSSDMYGAFLHTSSDSKISFADHSTRSVQLLCEEPYIDVFLIGGNSPEEIIYRYRKLTGFPAMPPVWSFGTWMSKMSYFSADEVNEVCNRLRQEGFPCDVIHLDTGWFRKDWLCEWKFNEERFPDPEKFMSDLRNRGFRISLWQMPYIAREAEQHDEAIKNKYIGKTEDASNRQDSNFSLHDYAGTIDFTCPKAVEWYKNLIGNLLKMGAACIKTDFGEEIHMDAEYYGKDPGQLSNLYALLYQKAAFEVTREITGDGIIWARAGWAGCQRYPVHWGGDAACSWDGMAGTLKGGLHLGLSGFGFWSHDVPGFHGLFDFMNAVIPEDLYVRWTQFGVFTSHLRYHGTSGREPYHHPNVAGIVRKWWRLRYALLPYILEQAEKTVRSGYPMLRALIFHHPDDRICWHIDDQYYFGDDFLVAPVMNSLNHRDIYLPEGEWINLFNGTYNKGPLWLKNFEAPLDEMPVWVRMNANIPIYPEKMECTDDYNPDKVISIKVNREFKGIWDSETGHLFNM
ncbi:MAG: alpha-xylosidase [Bacteroidales bacterium]|nr:alpha-xylosidase [Bacteroidales bacterium]